VRESDGDVGWSFLWVATRKAHGFKEDVVGGVDDSTMIRDRTEGDKMGVPCAILNTHLGMMSTVKVVIPTNFNQFTTFAWDRPLDNW